MYVYAAITNCIIFITDTHTHRHAYTFLFNKSRITFFSFLLFSFTLIFLFLFSYLLISFLLLYLNQINRIPRPLTFYCTDLKLLHYLVTCRKVLAEGGGKPSFLLLDGMKNTQQVTATYSPPLPSSPLLFSPFPSAPTFVDTIPLYRLTALPHITSFFLPFLSSAHSLFILLFIICYLALTRLLSHLN